MVMDWDNMQQKLEALYVLDNALTDPKKDYLRLVRKTDTDTETRYVVDNGAGDTLDVVFTQKATVIKGFDHENSLSQFAADEWNQKIIDRMYEGMDSVWSSPFLCVNSFRQSIARYATKSFRCSAAITCSFGQ